MGGFKSCLAALHISASWAMAHRRFADHSQVLSFGIIDMNNSTNVNGFNVAHDMIDAYQHESTSGHEQLSIVKNECIKCTQSTLKNEGNQQLQLDWSTSGDSSHGDDPVEPPPRSWRCCSPDFMGEPVTMSGPHDSPVARPEN